MDNINELIRVKNFVNNLNLKLENEEVLTEVEEKIISYISFLIDFKEKKNEDFTKILQRYHSTR